MNHETLEPKSFAPKSRYTRRGLREGGGWGGRHRGRMFLGGFLDPFGGYLLRLFFAFSWVFSRGFFKSFIMGILEHDLYRPTRNIIGILFSTALC